MSPIRREFFGDWKPASTLVAVSALALPELLVEVEAVAELGGGG
jgi:enamine deaminase RidA (YjgF/YER057c/UK114 family)